MNLLEETIRAIEEFRLKTENIIFIGSEESGHSCTWDEFQVISNKVYDSGYGGQQVAEDLIIVFKDKTRMIRGEYDGSEWWEIIRPFKMPKIKLPIKCMIRRNESTLKQMNK